MFLRVWYVVRERLINRKSNYRKHLLWTYRPLAEVHSKKEKSCMCYAKILHAVCANVTAYRIFFGVALVERNICSKEEERFSFS